ncbi:kinase-like domain-containing protein [Globomyces pollinis-pini]|nr:kinase-like domain-containing protein [Globomyces pollinis-pini]
MASVSYKKLTNAQQSDILNFLQSNKISSIGTYTLEKTIGEGSFGKVKLGRHTLTGQQVAIKIVDKINAPQLVREIETWRHLKHPNIAQLYEVLCSETKIYMVQEYCNGGEMLNYITKNGKMDDSLPQTVSVFQQIVEAVGKCHEKNFAHRDLKLENILLNEDFQVKLIDFGFTRWYEDASLLDTYCGSSAYAAPEILAGQKYSGPGADIWSLGVVLYTMVCGYLPFDEETESDTHKLISEIKYTIPEFLQQDTVNLIRWIFKKNPNERPTISQILKHPFFKIVAPSVMQTPTSAGSGPLLGTSSAELMLAAKLEAAGFNTTAILKSVHSNACDQASALWYLLLNKESDKNVEDGSPFTETPIVGSSSMDNIEIKVSGMDRLFENTHKTATLTTPNPLLQIVANTNEKNSQPPKGVQISPVSNANPFLAKRAMGAHRDSANTNDKKISQRPKSARSNRPKLLDSHISEESETDPSP